MGGGSDAESWGGRGCKISQGKTSNQGGMMQKESSYNEIPQGGRMIFR